MIEPDQVRGHVAQAHLPALLAALHCLTGDPDLIREGLRPRVAGLVRADHGLDAEQRAAATREATDALVGWMAAGRPAAGPPSEASMAAVVRFCGAPPADGPEQDYLPLLREELDDGDPRAPRWTAAELAADRDFRVVVIGAGLSGLAMAHRCRQAGLRVLVVEKNPDVGGTWWENTYPGCRVDVPSHLYTFSFAHRDDWPHVYSTQPTIRDYLHDTATDLGLRPHIRFDTEVQSARWDEDTRTWTVEVLGPDGPGSLTADVVVSAVGQLNRPHVPPIPGAAEFAGAAFHSAQWDHGVDLAGRHVAVIGTGASAAQIVPEIAGIAGRVSVYQRTPAWFVPSEDYRAETPAAHHWLCRHVPGYSRWYRFLLFRWWVEGLAPVSRVDPGWDGGGRSVSARNDAFRETLTRALRAACAGDEELFARLLPDYPPTAKRMIRDDGSWVRALRRDDVELVTTPIDHVTATGVATTDGRHRPADVIVWSTGFRAAEFLMPMTVTGRDGLDLHEHWSGDARAYLGITVPGFPNLFCLYGPNTNIVVNGSVTWLSECEVDYVMSGIETMLRHDIAALDCRPDVHDAYNARIDEANAGMAWGAVTVNSWYRNARGRIAQNWPGDLIEFWRLTRRLDPADYVLDARGGQRRDGVAITDAGGRGSAAERVVGRVAGISGGPTSEEQLWR